MASIVRTRQKKAKAPSCLLCGVPGIGLGLETANGMLFEHPPNGGCLVQLFYADGRCADSKYQVENGVIYDLDPPESVEQPPAPPTTVPEGEIVYLENNEVFADLDDTLHAIFAEHKQQFLGGSSGERGWSSISTYAKCPYLWSQTVAKKTKLTGEGVSVGTIVHVLLAVKYMKMIDAAYPLEPLIVYAQLMERKVNPAYVTEAWRVYQAYCDYYSQDAIEPLAIEHLLRDPRTGRTCRIDLIFRVTSTGVPGLVPGTYIMDHKTMKAFYEASLEWRNDGTILTQLDLWHELRLDKRFGELRAAVVNILGKQKDPKFERIIVPPVPRVLRDHRKHMPIWVAKLELDRAQGVFPRNRASCISQYGKCSMFDHCAGDIE